MLDAAQAILAVPGALQAFREILGSKKLDSVAALRELEVIRKNLLAFAAIEGWFDEAKRLHTHLQGVDTTLEKCTQCYMRALVDGAFQVQSYDLERAREYWDLAKAHSLILLIESFFSVRYEKKSTLMEVEPGIHRRVPEWSAKIIHLKRRIDEAFVVIDRGSLHATDQISEVATLIKELADEVKQRMIAADVAIYRRATQISATLGKLAFHLENG